MSSRISKGSSRSSVGRSRSVGSRISRPSRMSETISSAVERVEIAEAVRGATHDERAAAAGAAVDGSAAQPGGVGLDQARRARTGSRCRGGHQVHPRPTGRHRQRRAGARRAAAAAGSTTARAGSRPRADHAGPQVQRRGRCAQRPDARSPGRRRLATAASISDALSGRRRRSCPRRRPAASAICRVLTSSPCSRSSGMVAAISAARRSSGASAGYPLPLTRTLG